MDAPADLWATLAVLAAAGAAAVAILLALLRRERGRADARRALAGARGWTYRDDRSGLDPHEVWRLSDPAEGWRLSAFARKAGGRSRTSSVWTEWATDRRQSPEGVWLIGPGMPPGAARAGLEMLNRIDASLAGPILRMALGELADLAEGLMLVPEPGGRARRFTLLAPEPPTPGAADLDALEAALARGPADQPAVVAEPGRLRLRWVGVEFTDPARIGAALAQAGAVAAAFPPAAPG